MREPEGIARRYQESPRKGPGQNTENQTFATQRPRVRVPSHWLAGCARAQPSAQGTVSSRRTYD